MKKLIFLSLITFLSLTATQQAQAQFFKLGVKAGLVVNQSKMSIIGSDFSSVKPGFEIGVQTQLKLPVVGIFVQPEFVYSWVKSEYELPQSLGGAQSITTSQFDIPLLFGWQIAFFRIQLGPVFSFPITSFSGGRADFSRYTTSYAAGVGFNLGRFTLDARYQNSFAPRTTDITGTSQQIKMQDGRFNFSLGYTLFKI